MTARRALAWVNLAAIERNTQRIAETLHGGAALCAVVKADGYGHGLVQAARATLAGGASSLAVASAGEAAALRAAGVDGVPLIVMGALSDVERVEALAAGAELVVWREREVEAVARAGGGRLHVKLDTGMGRLGTRDPAQARRVLELAEGCPGVEVVGLMTHFATADDLHDDGFFAHQLELFCKWVQQVRGRSRKLVAHAANSAAVLRERASHLDMVRCGVSLYGMDPFGRDPSAFGLEPALELRSYVAEVKPCAAGQSAGYGRRFLATSDTEIAVLPIGYGDGWRRALSDKSEVLIGGSRWPLVGTVSMDNLTVELGARADSRKLLGAPAVLIGAQGPERITVEEVAERLSTINYEVTCGLTARVERRYHRDGKPIGSDCDCDERAHRTPQPVPGREGGSEARAGERRERAKLGEPR